MKRSRIVGASYVGLAAALLPAVWVGCTNPRVDAHCSPDSPSYKEDPRCIYSGTNELPAWNEGPCQPDGADAGVPPMPVCPADNAVNNAAVLSFLVDPKGGNCSAAACHGSVANPAAGILLDPNKPDEFYKTLTTVTGSVGTPYVVPGMTAYQQSWILCSLTAKKGGGYPMPPESGVPTYADANVVRDWLLCGAPGLK